MSVARTVFSPLTCCVVVVAVLFSIFVAVGYQAPVAKAKAVDTPSDQNLGTFSNPAPISPADRPSNNAGTNPGVPAANYPSNITVAGMSGTVTKITVTFALTTTFPDDVDILLVGPTGARSLVMSDAGGSGDITNVSFTFDQSAAGPIADGPTTPLPTGTFQPSNYAGLATPEPGGQDNFPTPGPGLLSYTAGFAVFNGTNPNGTWSLYVVDDQAIDTLSLPSGWTLDVTTGGSPGDAHVDFNGDGRSDYMVVRNVGGGAGGQIRWFIQPSSGTGGVAWDWGISSDFFVMEDFDGDNKDDVAVYRPGAPGVAAFYILNSSTLTARVELFGQSGDEPRVVGDYDGDGKADLAVYRAGQNSGDPSTWFYRGSLNNPGGNVTYVPWGQNGDFPGPGDYDGDGKWDFMVQRNNGGGQARFWRRYATGAIDSVVFGTPTDVIVPADYDGDGKFDIATVRGSAGSYNWYWDDSSTPALETNVRAVFGASATDFFTQGDYDGDGKSEPAVWRPSASAGQSAFWVQGSMGSTFAVPFGQNGDYPVANFRRF